MFVSSGILFIIFFVALIGVLLCDLVDIFSKPENKRGPFNPKKYWIDRYLIIALVSWVMMLIIPFI